MQFQTENVLNSIDNVKKAADIGMTAGTGFILRNGMFYNVNNIVNKAVKKTAATSGVLEKWTVAMPDVTYYSGKLFRFLLDVRLKGDVRSDYDRYSVYKGKPFYVEFTTTETHTAYALADILKTINTGLTKQGYKDVTVTTTGGVGTYGTYTGTPTGAATAVTITAVKDGVAGNITLTADSTSTIAQLITAHNAANPTNTVTLVSGSGTQVPTANIVLSTGTDATNDGFLVVEGTFYSQVFDALLIQESKDNSTSSYSADVDFETLFVGTKTVAAVEPFGSAWYITKNLRLPSSSNTRFMAINEDERPIDGALYNQYSFDYSVVRDITGMNAVGQSLTSVTNHIIYVKSDLSSDFETLLLTSTGLSIA